MASHTGALAADERIWQAISRATGLTVVSSFEELVGSLRFLQRYAGDVAVAGSNVLIAGVGGGGGHSGRTGLAVDVPGVAGRDPDPIVRVIVGQEVHADGRASGEGDRSGDQHREGRQDGRHAARLLDPY